MIFEGLDRYTSTERPSRAPDPGHIVFGPQDRPLAGWYHAPRPDTVRFTAVLLSKPIGHEGINTHATYRYLAEQLAEAGYPTLRFDYDGTGDSFGSDED